MSNRTRGHGVRTDFLVSALTRVHSVVRVFARGLSRCCVAADVQETMLSRQRFMGAGGSAERIFKRQRRQNVRDALHVWLLMCLGVAALAGWSSLASGVAARLLAGAAGLLLGVLLVLWALGGHVSAFRWWLGAEGERETAREIEKLGTEWHCEHDLEHAHGNWDHVLVGPAGVFLLDSKFLHGTAAAGEDALRSGRLAFAGGNFRFGAMRINQLLEQQLGFRAPWVQAVAIVWGDFPQGRHEEQNVVYLRGDRLRPWLAELPERVNAPQRAALVTALHEIRGSLSTP